MSDEQREEGAKRKPLALTLSKIIKSLSISEKIETRIKQNPMPLRCRQCISGELKCYCLVCNVMDYEQITEGNEQGAKHEPKNQ